MTTLNSTAEELEREAEKAEARAEKRKAHDDRYFELKGLARLCRSRANNIRSEQLSA